ncbi:unnamed protein product [Paramecium pentaurelia]|uniref:Uncharacterized protein n=1 Tax=Paramecium pentaurelia TaxID=43138 RepID=A0A8S1Y6P3_9CILI|nr:unnamed protein product [Paramecium pentaurelia]
MNMLIKQMRKGMKGKQDIVMTQKFMQTTQKMEKTLLNIFKLEYCSYSSLLSIVKHLNNCKGYQNIQHEVDQTKIATEQIQSYIYQIQKFN